MTIAPFPARLGKTEEFASLGCQVIQNPPPMAYVYTWTGLFGWALPKLRDNALLFLLDPKKLINYKTNNLSPHLVTPKPQGVERRTS